MSCPDWQAGGDELDADGGGRPAGTLDLVGGSFPTRSARAQVSTLRWPLRQRKEAGDDKALPTCGFPIRIPSESDRRCAGRLRSSDPHRHCIGTRVLVPFPQLRPASAVASARMPSYRTSGARRPCPGRPRSRREGRPYCPAPRSLIFRDGGSSLVSPGKQCPPVVRAISLPGERPGRVVNDLPQAVVVAAQVWGCARSPSLGELPHWGRSGRPCWPALPQARRRGKP